MPARERPLPTIVELAQVLANWSRLGHRGDTMWLQILYVEDTVGNVIQTQWNLYSDTMEKDMSLGVWVSEPFIQTSRETAGRLLEKIRKLGKISLDTRPK